MRGRGDNEVGKKVEQEGEVGGWGKVDCKKDVTQVHS